jgi:hypothetical protein
MSPEPGEHNPLSFKKEKERGSYQPYPSSLINDGSMRPGLFRTKLTMRAVVRPLESTYRERDLMKIRILVRPHDPKAYDTDWQSRL